MSEVKVGNRYGSLMVVMTRHGGKNLHATAECICDCGHDRVVRHTRLRRGLVSSCAACAKRAAAAIGGVTRRLPWQVAAVREAFGVYRGNAKRKRLAFSLPGTEFGALVSTPCFYCGAPATPIYGLDRTDNNLGYILENIVPCCRVCNYAKRDMKSVEFLNWVERIHAHQSLLQRH